MSKLNEPATKGDLQLMKADLRKLLSIEIAKTHVRIDRSMETLSAQMRENTSHILKVVGDSMAQSQKIDRDQVITNYRVDELDKRVKTLETAR